MSVFARFNSEACDIVGIGRFGLAASLSRDTTAIFIIQTSYEARDLVP